MSEHKMFLTDGQRSALRIIIGLGLVVFLAAWHWIPERAWADLLVGNFYFVSLSLAAACSIAIQYLSSAGWSVLFRRVPESMTAYLPVGAAVAVFSLLGVWRLYPWAHPDLVAADSVLQGKTAFLNTPAFAFRMVLYFATWIILIRKLVGNSRAQDRYGGLEYTRQNRKISTIYLLVFALTYSLAAVDWLMSLEPHWYSTLYPWYVFSGALISALAVISQMTVTLRRRGFFQEITEFHFHDLGKFVFAFSVFWAYLWFCQFLLIWYTNIPEETSFYVRRLAPGWKEMFWLNPVLNFAAPFFLLLKIQQKKKFNTLLMGAWVLALGHWLDLYLLIMPAADGAHPCPRLVDAFIFSGFAAAFLLCFDRAFRSAEPVPLRDPLIEESVHFHG